MEKSQTIERASNPCIALREPSEVANVSLFLASAASVFVQGGLLFLWNGGMNNRSLRVAWRPTLAMTA